MACLSSGMSLIENGEDLSAKLVHAGLARSAYRRDVATSGSRSPGLWAAAPDGGRDAGDGM